MIDQEYIIIAKFLNSIEKENTLESGSYLLTFFADDEMGISFSVTLKNKRRLKLVNNKVMQLNQFNIFEVRFSFDIGYLCYCYFGVTFEEFIVYAPKEKLKLLANALTEIYLYSAKIPTNLL